ncbi:MAG: PDZ domain-containing protein [Myxococcales bacterium]|nr:PDZ domain-containing protein [Myxococcales bacterium]
MRTPTLILSALLLVAAPALAQPKPKARPPAKPPASAAPAKPPSSSWSFSFQSGRGRFGVQATDMTEELRDYFGAPKTTGVLVQRVQPGTPAAKAGLKVGDVITRVGNDSVESPSDVSRAIADKKKGETVPVSIVRGRRPLQLTAKLDSDPPADAGLDFDFSFDGFGDLFKGANPGASKRFFKQWQWKWPSDAADDQSSAPGAGRLDQRMKELEKRFREMEKRQHPAPGKTKP